MLATTEDEEMVYGDHLIHSRSTGNYLHPHNSIEEANAEAGLDIGH